MNSFNLLRLVTYLTRKGDFEKIVSEIFNEIFEAYSFETLIIYNLLSDGETLKSVLSKTVIAEEDDYANRIENLKALGMLKNSVSYPISIQNKTVMYLTALKENMTEEEQRVVSSVAMLIQSIAVSLNLQDSLTISYNVLEDTFNHLPIGIAILDKEERNVLFMNKSAGESESVQNAIGLALSEYIFSGKEHIEEIYEEKFGLWYDVEFKKLKWIDKRTVLMASTIDVTQKVKNKQLIEYQANNDYLTGLFNRMKCERDLKTTLNLIRNNGEKGVAIFLDLDNFKQVNDGLGHQYGDMLLQKIAEYLQSIPELKSSVYRMGGDEFLIIVKPEFFDAITTIVDAISKRFNEQWQLWDVDYYCTMSMGLTIFPEKNDEVNDVIKRADYAMYEAKKEGKNRYLWYTSKHEEESRKKLQLEDSIKELVGNECNDFEIHYQPIVNSDGKVVGAEALVRIVNKELGILMPAEFLPVAEYLGIMNKIGNYVFTESCNTLKLINRNNPDFKMFINMAPTQLMVSKASDILLDIINKSGVKYENIYCEVSEKTEFRDENTALSTMEILNAHGVKISLDDFGAGKISLDFLKRSKATVIKFDPSFSKLEKSGGFGMTILKSISSVAKDLNIKIAFVGIEDENQEKLAKSLGADFLEGFYYGNAITKQELLKII